MLETILIVGIFGYIYIVSALRTLKELDKREREGRERK
jgi:hypothetical protein